MTAPYQNRQEAGRLLARSLEKCADRDDVLVLAVSCGGVLVAVEVAEVLSEPLDMIVIQQFSAPMHDAWQADRMMGAVVSGGTLVFNNEVVDALQLPAREVEQAVAFARRNLIHKEQACRGTRPFPDIRGRAVILIDDCIETAATMRVGIEAMKRGEAKRVTVATPVGSACMCRQLAREADELICLWQPNCSLVSYAYRDFPLVSDEEARTLLESYRQKQRAWSERTFANQKM